MTVSIHFLGANRQVTGSKHLLKINDKRILLECGMVQGPRRLADRLNRELPEALGRVDAVVLSHAHIDHSGSLPRLVRMGYSGPIHCTEATADLLGILLPDSAHIQKADARYLKKRGKSFQPAYDIQDVEDTLALLQTHAYRQSFEVLPGVRVTFLEAGHILGSAQVMVEVEDGDKPLRIAFTGDLGRKGIPVLRDPDPLPACDVLITESTYGDRRHPPRDVLEQQLLEFFQDETCLRGRILIPAYSVGRTQNVLWYLGRMIAAGQIEPIPIYIDSPLSTKATRIVNRHKDLYDREAREYLESGRNPFFFEGVRYIADVEESKALNKLTRGIIISASGMCEGGRILHHLEQTVGRENDCILIVGFMAEGTLGRKLLERYDYVKIFGERHLVRCRVRHIDGLSAHADYQEMLDHFAPIATQVEQAFIVHGEESASMRFADRMIDAGFRSVEVPLYKEEFVLGT